MSSGACKQITKSLRYSTCTQMEEEGSLRVSVLMIWLLLHTSSAQFLQDRYRTSKCSTLHLAMSYTAVLLDRQTCFFLLTPPVLGWQNRAGVTLSQHQGNTFTLTLCCYCNACRALQVIEADVMHAYQPHHTQQGRHPSGHPQHIQDVTLSSP